ncbi:hypothetical protein SNEBB_005128 [Seison nebaliae]|nr:hypothetical protein SNEBB_005128 [Seison nebaliae]
MWKKIKRLPDDVVNMIAAGEVIQRPYNVVKELVENSIDAKSTRITVMLLNGGLNEIVIQDNGCGISKEDLLIAFDRHTTSKLKEYEQLEKGDITTFGFRGEALSSIASVANVRMMSRMNGSMNAFEISNMNGRSLHDEPKCCASSEGTKIIVKNLFFNLPNRKHQILNCSIDEYLRCEELIRNYSIHYPHIQFSISKSTISTYKSRGKQSLNDVLANAFSSELSKNYLHISKKKVGKSEDDTSYSYDAYVSPLNVKLKQNIFILFINNRPVQQSSLRRSIFSVYEQHLPKGAKPFVYINLQIRPDHVDVNIHPSKTEVKYLGEDEINRSICEELEEEFDSANRTLSTQPTCLSTISFIDNLDKTTEIEKRNNLNNIRIVNEKSRNNSQNRYRNRSINKEQSIKAFMNFNGNMNDKRSGYIMDLLRKIKEKKEKDISNNQMSSSLRYLENERNCQLDSVGELKNVIEKNCNRTLTIFLRETTFVGCLDENCLLLQHDTSLYIVNFRVLLAEFFYQFLLFQFANFSLYQFDEELDLKDLIRFVKDDEEFINNSTISSDKFVDEIYGILMENREMLEDYFSILITEKGKVFSIPNLLKFYKPSIDMLPYFFVRLAIDVNWSSENECLGGIAEQLASFYSIIPLNELDMKLQLNNEVNNDKSNEFQKKILNNSEVIDRSVLLTDTSPLMGKEEDVEGMEKLKMQVLSFETIDLIEHFLYPTVRSLTLMTNDLKEINKCRWKNSMDLHLYNLKEIINKITDVHQLYKHFERC